MKSIHLLRVALASQLFIASWALCVWAHPPDADGSHHDHDDGVDASARALLLPNLDGPTPWTDKPVLNAPDRFHFAIMSDRTGGHRPGIWMQAVELLNLMRPEFVVSVGDLIEGYTNDSDVLQKEWQEFLGFLDHLDMRFFFVAGNHDLSNSQMHKLWREQFGREWYSFDYHDVHFVCLCSEDPVSRIGDEQLSWVKKDLQEHEDARWTLVFIHKPLWTYAERAESRGQDDPTNWSEISELLASRPHHVFAGHHHNYVQFRRNGTNYYQLATTGGGSSLRGKAYGEFDHVVWVTMEKEGPRIANLLLDGVLPADVSTEESLDRFHQFLNQSLIEIAPVLIETGKEFYEGTVRIRLTNQFNQAIELDGEIAGLPLRGMTAETTKLTLQVEPGASEAFDFKFRVAEPIPVLEFSHTTLNAKIRTVGDDPLRAEIVVPVTVAHRYQCSPLQITLDGKLDDWSGTEFSTPEQPRIVGAFEQWKGLNDGSVRFRVAFDDQQILFGGHVSDEMILPKVDSLYFFIDPRPLQQRSQERVAPVRGKVFSFNVDISKGWEAPSIQGGTLGGARDSIDTSVVTRRVEDGYDFELSIPIHYLTRIQGDDWESFQLNCGLRDADQPEDDYCLIPWRGSFHDGNTTSHYAHFFRRR
ncbi:MAG: metallophosphoesterase [Pirellulaceae bacterium]|nr:metallophosphoesterase [Pirellulaceae bacterium]